MYYLRKCLKCGKTMDTSICVHCGFSSVNAGIVSVVNPFAKILDNNDSDLIYRDNFYSDTSEASRLLDSKRKQLIDTLKAVLDLEKARTIGSLNEVADQKLKEQDEIQQLIKNADAGDSDAQLKLGVLYLGSEKLPQNYALAMKYLLLSSKQGNDYAMHNIGWMYEMGYGVQQDIEKARKWYQLSYEKGNDLSAFSLSDLSNPYETSVDFFMPVENVFTLTGRGTAVVGKILLGRINLGDKVEVILRDGRRLKTTITSIEMFKKTLKYALEGDNVGVLLRGVKKEDLIDAQALVNPDADVLRKRFRGSLYVLKKDEGGKHHPIFNYYKPFLRLVSKDYRGLISFDPFDMYIGDSELTSTGEKPPIDYMLLPGCSANVHIEFDTPTAIFSGMQFDVHEGDSVVTAKLTVEEPED